jgi:salicylate hydroxylase
VFYPDKRQLFSGIDDYMIRVPTTKIRQNPKLAPLLDTTNSWWGPTGCVIAGVAGIGEDVEYCMEFCILSEKAGSEGNLVTITNIDKIKGAFKDWDPALIELLNFAGQAKTWRLAYTTPDLDWVSKSGRTVLIGDAAHAMLPHAMAVSLNIFDAPILIILLMRISGGHDSSRRWCFPGRMSGQSRP